MTLLQSTYLELWYPATQHRHRQQDLRLNHQRLQRKNPLIVPSLCALTAETPNIYISPPLYPILPLSRS